MVQNQKVNILKQNSNNFGKNNNLKKFTMNKFLNRLLFIGFIPIMILIICLATILVLPYWLVTGKFTYDVVNKINDWWWELKTK